MEPPGKTYVLSHLSHIWLFVTLWAVAHRASLAMGFSTRAYWSGLPFPYPEDLPNPVIKTTSVKSPAMMGNRNIEVSIFLFGSRNIGDIKENLTLRVENYNV